VTGEDDPTSFFVFATQSDLRHTLNGQVQVGSQNVISGRKSLAATVSLVAALRV
jgi:hypothetical protein